MPLRGNKTFSLVKSKKGGEDGCILQNIRPIDDSPVYSSSTLGRITVTSPTSKARERSYSLTNPSQRCWNNSLSAATVDCNSNPSVELKGAMHNAELHKLSEEGNAAKLIHDPSSLKDSAVQAEVLKSLHNCPNKLQDNCKGKKVISSGHARSYSSITGPISIDPSTRPLPNYNSSQFPSMEKQQQALLLLADKQSLTKPSMLDSNFNETDKSYHTVTASNSRELLKEFNSCSKPCNGGSKAPSKIHRTIRSLYDGNSEKKFSVDKIDKSMDDVDGMKLSKPMSLGLKVAQTRLEKKIIHEICFKHNKKFCSFCGKCALA